MALSKKHAHRKTTAIGDLAKAIVRGETFTSHEEAVERATAIWDRTYELFGFDRAEHECQTHELGYSDM